MHLLLCGWCRRYMDNVELLRSAPMQTDAPTEGRSELSTAAKERIRQRLEAK
jgi:hypothetical protein